MTNYNFDYGVPSKIIVMPVHPDLVLTKMVDTILTCEADLFELIVDVNTWARKTKTEWVQNRSTNIKELDSFHDERVLVNYMGMTTVIPDYDAYSETWRKSLHFNPFEVEWLNYDSKDGRANKYVDLVLDTLHKQAVIWSSDADTRVCLVYAYFERFIKSLQRLYEYGLEKCISSLNDLKVNTTSP